MSELRERVAKALHEDRIASRQCLLNIDQWRECRTCNRNADAALAALDLPALLAAKRRDTAEAIARKLETMCSCGPDRPDLLAECEYRDAAAMARRHATENDGAGPTEAPASTLPAQEAESVAPEAGEGQGRSEGHRCPVCGEPVTGADPVTYDATTGPWRTLVCVGSYMRPCGCYVQTKQPSGDPARSAE